MNNDLISREALKKTLTSETRDIYEFVCLSRILEKIDNAPTVETDIEVATKDAYEHGYADGWKERFGEPDGRPKGEWKRRSMNEYLCSNCRYNVSSVESLFYKFCPKCGSDMRGANNG